MITTNKEIVERIREARQSKGITQQNLAEILGKTSAAISDMERGKVQISASELAIIANTLDTPIEYFYGLNYSGQDIQEIMRYMQKETPEQAKQSMDSIRMLVRLRHLGEIFQQDDKQPTPEEIGKFVTDFVNYSKQMTELTGQLNTIKDQLFQALKEQGISISPDEENR
jgi:transcriptional regulator with XRE-family HTH domain